VLLNGKTAVTFEHFRHACQIAEQRALPASASVTASITRSMEPGRHGLLDPTHDADRILRFPVV
jgi:hypothetical protein